MGFMSQFLYSQFIVKPTFPTHSFAGQTIIVTGSNTGLGLEAARHIARLGASKIILAVRSTSKGEAAKESIVKTTKCNPGSIEIWTLDMQSPDSVKAFAQRAQGLERIDALIENAGVSPQSWQTTPDGQTETTIQVNVISTFLLALLLLPKLCETAKKFDTLPHLTIVTSEMHHFAEPKEMEGDNVFPRLAQQEYYAGDPMMRYVDALLPGDPGAMLSRARYQVSKAMEIFFVREMVARQQNDASVVINLVNPGWCHSEFLRDMTGAKRVALRIVMAVMARSTECGSRNLVAASVAGKESHGKYMSDCEVQESSVAPYMLDQRGKAIQKGLYEQMMKVLEGIEEAIGSNVRT